MMSGPLKNFGVHGPYTRFHPFDLQPGQARLLFIEALHPSCTEAPGSTFVVNGFSVRFSFLWRSATALIPLDQQQLAVITPKEGC